jgi:hypothetical protein
MDYLIKTNVTNQYGKPAYFTGFMNGQRLFIWSHEGNEVKTRAVRFPTEQAAQAYINEFEFSNCSIEQYDVEQPAR